MNDNEEVVISKMMLPHLGLPLTDVTWHVNVTFGVGASVINVDDEPTLGKQGIARYLDGE